MGRQEAAFITYVNKVLGFEGAQIRRGICKLRTWEICCLDRRIDAESDLCLVDMIADKRLQDPSEMIVDRLEDITADVGLYFALTGLPCNQQEVLRALVLDEVSEAAYAKAHGVSRQAVNKTKRKALKSLKAELGRGKDNL